MFNCTAELNSIDILLLFSNISGICNSLIMSALCSYANCNKQQNPSLAIVSLSKFNISIIETRPDFIKKAFSNIYRWFSIFL